MTEIPLILYKNEGRVLVGSLILMFIGMIYFGVCYYTVKNFWYDMSSVYGVIWVCCSPGFAFGYAKILLIKRSRVGLTDKGEER